MRTLSLSLVLIVGLGPHLSQAADWPQYRGIRGDGKSHETIPTVDWPSQGPRQLWKVPTPLGFSSFTVATGRAFTLTAESNSNGDTIETCLALDANTGRELWKVPLGLSDYEHDGGNSGAENNRGGDGPRSTPTTDGARVYVYDSHLLLNCFDAGTGEVIWSVDVKEQYDGPNIKWYNAASPLLDDQVVYIPGGGPGQSFLAFDKQTGKLLWKSGDETMTHATATLATIHRARQVVFFTQSGLVAVDAANGQERWRRAFPFSVSTAASPVAQGDLVYCSAGYGVGAGLFQIDQEGETFDVERVWFKANELMNHWSTPLYHEGYLYGIFGFKKYGTAPLQCVELASGEIQWSQRGFGPGNCILVGDKLVVLADDGRLVVAEATPEAYRELGSAQVVSGKCWSTPAFSDGRVFVRSTQEGACLELVPSGIN